MRLCVHLQALVERLHCLDLFLADFVGRRQQRGYSARYSSKQSAPKAMFGGGFAPTAEGLFGPSGQVNS